MKLRLIWNLRVAALAAVLAIGAASIAAAQTAKQPVTDDPDVRVTVAGQTVSIDAKTGKLRPLTPQEAQSLGEALRRQYGRAPHQPTVIEDASGMVIAEVPEDYMEVSIARLNSDGTLSTECVKGTGAAALSLEAPAKPATDDCETAAPALSVTKRAAKAAVKSRRAVSAKPARKAAKTTKTAAVRAGKE